MHLKKGKCNWANLTIALIKASWDKSEDEPKQERRRAGTRAKTSRDKSEDERTKLGGKSGCWLVAHSSSPQQLPVFTLDKKEVAENRHTLFLDDEYKEENVGIIVWMTVTGTYTDTEHVKFKTLPAVKVASCIIKGSYDQMGEAYATVASWIKANGYKMNGHMFNIYHVSPAQTQNPDEYVTEACFPVE